MGTGYGLSLRPHSVGVLGIEGVVSVRVCAYFVILYVCVFFVIVCCLFFRRGLGPMSVPGERSIAPLGGSLYPPAQ